MLRCFPKYYKCGRRRRPGKTLLCWHLRTDDTSCKAHLKLAKSRARLMKQQIHASSGATRREIAQFLSAKKEVEARIRAEQFIQEQHTGLALEIFESLCESLSCRMELLFTNDNNNQCPSELLGVANSILYCEPRLKIKELGVVRRALQRKFGKEWVEEAVANKNGDVNFHLAYLLNEHGTSITEFSIVALMHSVTQEYGVEWSASIPLDATSGSTTAGTRPSKGVKLNALDWSPEGPDTPIIWPSWETPSYITGSQRGTWVTQPSRYVKSPERSGCPDQLAVKESFCCDFVPSPAT